MKYIRLLAAILGLSITVFYRNDTRIPFFSCITSSQSFEVWPQLDVRPESEAWAALLPRKCISRKAGNPGTDNITD